jgi:CxxC-x17-CxxC domain-containing protein
MSQKTMFEAKCTDCGKIALVPFKPTEGKPVYCKECFSKHSKKPANTNRLPRKNDSASAPTPIVIGKEGWARRRDNGFARKEAESAGAFHKFTPAP